MPLFYPHLCITLAGLVQAGSGGSPMASPLLLSGREQPLFKRIITQDTFGDHVDEVRLGGQQ